MLPVTHGEKFTRLHILLYSVALWATTMLPYVIGMSGLLYLALAMSLGLWFVFNAYRLFKSYSDQLARKLFRDSIIYLSLLFAALLLDHWVVSQ
jgi:protoheme IX farnesyltransferase